MTILLIIYVTVLHGEGGFSGAKITLENTNSKFKIQEYSQQNETQPAAIDNDADVFCCNVNDAMQ